MQWPLKQYNVRNTAHIHRMVNVPSGCGGLVSGSMDLQLRDATVDKYHEELWGCRMMLPAGGDQPQRLHPRASPFVFSPCSKRD
jgi:hypothetical protein